MKIVETNIPGVLIIEPRVFEDARGYFFESWSRRAFEEATGTEAPDWVQDNESKSVRGVVRGLHFQLPPHTQAKLVRCVHGAVVDVALDIRRGSPTYGQYVAVELSEDNKRQLLLPRGMAHGFAVLSPEAVFQYKCDNYYAPQADGGLSILDPSLKIEWGIDIANAILSDKDRHHPRLADFETPFVF